MPQSLTNTPKERDTGTQANKGCAQTTISKAFSSPTTKLEMAQSKQLTLSAKHKLHANTTKSSPYNDNCMEKMHGCLHACVRVCVRPCVCVCVCV